MIQFYFPIWFIPKNDGGDPNSMKYTLIDLPNHCTKCQFEFVVREPGSEKTGTILEDYCEHIYTWNNIWEIKINKTKISSLKNDGCFCDKCTEWSPMAISNLAENKFRCYRCRQNPY